MIGERLAEVRKDHRDKQSDLAAKLSVTLSTIRSWEQEKSSPPHDMLVSICRQYGVSSDYLLGVSDVDPAYVQRQRLERFSKVELDELKSYEEFLLWRRANTEK